MTILFMLLMALAVYLSLGRSFFSNLFSTMTESKPHETLENEIGKDWQNYHKNIYDAMFWGGATKEQLDRYEEEYL